MICAWIAPLKLYGSGSYALSAVKDIVTTDSFDKLGQDKRNCQYRQTYEDCTTTFFSKSIQQECNCTLYSLRNYSRLDEVRGFLKDIFVEFLLANLWRGWVSMCKKFGYKE